MKKFGQLVDECMFEAGVKGHDPIETWFALTIKEVLDKYTGYVSYPDLLTPNQQSFIGAGPFGSFVLPVNMQRFDYDSVIFVPAGDLDRAVKLNQAQSQWVATDTGFVQEYLILLGSMELFPSSEIVSGDAIQYSYWQTGSSLLTDYDQFILPDLLVNVVKNEVIGIANLVLGGKNAAAYFTIAKDARLASFGSTDLPPMN